MKKKQIDFSEAVEKFFSEYLLKERRYSYNTLRSYKDMVAKLLDFFKQEKATAADKITIEHINRENIVSFLNWLEKDNSTSTCNQRLGAIKSFAKYMMYVDPMHLAQWKGLSTLKPKRGTKGTLGYLTVEAMAFLLEQIDGTTPSGLRDLAMISLMYHTGARVQEMADLTVDCIRWSKPHIIQITGKGSKKRIVPIADDIIALIKQYLEYNLPDYKNHPDHPLFYNVWHDKLTTSGIAYVLKKYADVAKKIRRDLYPEKISPHVLRHTKAMHMLEGGAQLYYIRDLLGHVSVTTTEIYARADSKQKREALETAYEMVGVTEPEVKSWQKSRKLLDTINDLLK